MGHRPPRGLPARRRSARRRRGRRTALAAEAWDLHPGGPQRGASARCRRHHRRPVRSPRITVRGPGFAHPCRDRQPRPRCRWALADPGRGADLPAERDDQRDLQHPPRTPPPRRPRRRVRRTRRHQPEQTPHPRDRRHPRGIDPVLVTPRHRYPHTAGRADSRVPPPTRARAHRGRDVESLPGRDVADPPGQTPVAVVGRATPRLAHPSLHCAREPHHPRPGRGHQHQPRVTSLAGAQRNSHRGYRS
ncbi:Uncharacterised protein [Nocardia africana]|uniref:Uncharacterized protein n=1 Tax=Nocardia africana TaxID=134964 RepID=A0A378X3B9_9NOCA|nr:Uncharacterised protein [Nocardia africana]